MKLIEINIVLDDNIVILRMEGGESAHIPVSPDAMKRFVHHNAEVLHAATGDLIDVVFAAAKR